MTSSGEDGGGGGGVFSVGGVSWDEIFYENYDYSLNTTEGNVCEPQLYFVEVL